MNEFDSHNNPLSIDVRPNIFIPGGLSSLDKIQPVPQEIVPPDVCMDVLGSAANVGKQQMKEIIESELNYQNSNDSSDPTSFREMLDTSKGHFIQRISKAWIKPTNPEGTVKLMKALQVDHFQQIPIKAMDWVRRKMGVERRQGNYTLGDTSLNNLVDFATNRSGMNEAIHLYGMALCAATILPSALNGNVDGIVVINTGMFIINSYCVLAQRYARARLTIGIDRALQKNRHFDPEKFKNHLDLTLPQQ
jgi:hypothetical protein